MKIVGRSWWIKIMIFIDSFLLISFLLNIKINSEKLLSIMVVSWVWRNSHNGKNIKKRYINKQKERRKKRWRKERTFSIQPRRILPFQSLLVQFDSRKNNEKWEQEKKLGGKSARKVGRRWTWLFSEINRQRLKLSFDLCKEMIDYLIFWQAKQFSCSFQFRGRSNTIYLQKPLFSFTANISKDTEID